MSTDVSPADSPDRVPKVWLIAAVLVGAALVVGYLPALRALVFTWESEPNYSHGFLVLPIAGLLLYQRRHKLDVAQLRPNPLGWAAFVAILGFRAYLYQINELWFEQVTIPLDVTALLLAFGGWRLVWWALPAILFSFLMFPLPAGINNKMAGPLQIVATSASAFMLQITGLPVLVEGNVITVGVEQLEVARACNGLSMLLSFATLIIAFVLFFDDWPLWERIVLLFSTIPIALLANIIRIVLTGWCYYLFGPSYVIHYGFGKTTVGDLCHAAAGWGMMPIALLLIWFEIKILSWIIVPQEILTTAVVHLPLEQKPRIIKK